MKFTPGQMREVLDVPVETFRHWKKALPPLSKRNGYRPCFSSGDLVALAAVKLLTDDGVRVSGLSHVSVPLFVVCNTFPWAAVERGVLTLDLARGAVRLTQLSKINADRTLVVLSGSALIQRLRDGLREEQIADAQGQLRYPPRPVARRASAKQ